MEKRSATTTVKSQGGDYILGWGKKLEPGLGVAGLHEVGVAFQQGDEERAGKVLFGFYVGEDLVADVEFEFVWFVGLAHAEVGGFAGGRG